MRNLKQCIVNMRILENLTQKILATYIDIALTDIYRTYYTSQENLGIACSLQNRILINGTVFITDRLLTSSKQKQLD